LEPCEYYLGYVNLERKGNEPQDLHETEKGTILKRGRSSSRHPKPHNTGSLISVGGGRRAELEKGEGEEGSELEKKAM